MPELLLALLIVAVLTFTSCAETNRTQGGIEATIPEDGRHTYWQRNGDMGYIIDCVIEHDGVTEVVHLRVDRMTFARIKDSSCVRIMPGADRLRVEPCR